MRPDRARFADGPAAVVVGAGLNGLGVVRSLARTGVRVWLLEADLDQPTARTRLAKRRKARSLRDERLVEDLLLLADEVGGRPVLFLTQEASVRLVSEARERLAQRYALRLPSRETLLALTTKDGFRAEAEAQGAPIPRTAAIGEPCQMARLDALRPPFVLKPDERDAAYDSRFRKAYRLESRAALDAKLAEILPHYRRLVVQEWIEGPDNEIHFCLQHRGADGEARMSFCGRKNRSYPPGTGGTASCTIAPADAWEPLTRLTDAFFAKAGVVGLCSMEYKRRPEGDWLMIEPTIGRTDYQEEVATLHGYNVVAAAYADLAFGARVSPEPGPRPLLWADPVADAAARAADPGRADLPGRRVNAYLAADDPGPWCAWMWTRAQGRLGRERPAA